MIVTIYMIITYSTMSVPSPYQVRTKSDTCSIQVHSKFLQNLPKTRLTFCYFSTERSIGSAEPCFLSECLKATKKGTKRNKGYIPIFATVARNEAAEVIRKNMDCFAPLAMTSQ